ncbi:metabotropic glutamate receptor 1 [Biomphalaria glabrata]|nr:metabotropic glutamate receptor 1 [Biomphalaria glabrata]
MTCNVTSVKGRSMSLSLRSVLLTVTLVMVTRAYVLGDRRLGTVYKDLGDLNLGGLFSVSAYDNLPVCGKLIPLEAFRILRVMYILTDTIRSINENNTILPGVKLGFAFLDFCSNTNAAMIQAARFLPRSNPSDYIDTNESNYLTSYKVVGMIGTANPYVQTPTSILFSSAGIPVISVWSEPRIIHKLQSQHSSVLYLSSMKRNLVEAMISYLVAYQWMGVSVLVENNEAGRLLLEFIVKKLKAQKICISMASAVTETSDSEEIIKSLTQSQSKVVMMFVESATVNSLLHVIGQESERRKLVMLLSEDWTPLVESEWLVHGMVLFTHLNLGLDTVEFRHDALRLIPWIKKFMQESHCELDGCMMYVIDQMSVITMDDVLIHDALMVYVFGLQSLLREKCPSAKGAQAKTCFEKHSGEFLEYLKEVSFRGKSGNILNRESGNKLDPEKVYVYQILVEEKEVIEEEQEVVHLATYYIKTKAMEFLMNVNIDWVDFPLSKLDIKSHCQYPCSPREIRVRKGECCWQCFLCQNNERIVNNETACEECPPLTWPAMNAGTLSVCVDVELTVFDMTNPVTIATLIADLAGVIMVVYVCAMLKFRYDTLDLPLPMLLMQVLFIVLGYASVPLFLKSPTPLTCNAANLLFTVSFSGQYLCQFLICIQAYRKYHMPAEDVNVVNLTDGVYQKAYITAALIIQVAVYSALHFLHPVTVYKQQPILGEPLVEFTCNIPILHTVVFIIFSITCLLICSVFSFKSHNQERESLRSRYQSMYVFIALVMWIAFMPSYLTATSQMMKIFFLILAVLVNHFSALVLNFVPSLILSRVIKQSRESGPLMLLQNLSERRKSRKSSARKVSTAVDKPVQHEEFEQMTPKPSLKPDSSSSTSPQIVRLMSRVDSLHPLSDGNRKLL